MKRRYEPMQPQRDEMISIMKAVNECRMRILEVSRSFDDTYKGLSDAESHLCDCLSDIGEVVGITVACDISEGVDVKG